MHVIMINRHLMYIFTNHLQGIFIQNNRLGFFKFIRRRKVVRIYKFDTRRRTDEKWLRE